MQTQRSIILDITQQIKNQVQLLEEETDLARDLSARARLEAIIQFASQGLHALDQPHKELPNANG